MSTVELKNLSMDSKLISLTAKAFSDAILSCLHTLYRSVILCDVTLVAQNSVVFPAHKVVLASASGYFRSLLDQGCLLDEDRHLLTGMPASQLKILLDFMYTGTLQLTESNLGLIQKAAEQLKIEEAVRLCKEYTENQECKEVKQELDEETWLVRFQRCSEDEESNTGTVTQMTFHDDLHSDLDLHSGPRKDHHSSGQSTGQQSGHQSAGRTDVKKKCCKNTDNLESAADVSTDDGDITNTDPEVNGLLKCDICGKSYQTRDGLRRHKRVHSNEYPYRCEECQKGFHYENALMDHMRTKHQESAMKCALCSCCVQTVAGWKLHASLHERNESFPCDKCCKTFPNKIYLNRHKKTHTREFVCAICSKTFTSKQHLKTHAIIHQSDFSLSCDICSFVTKHKGSLIRHKNTAHSSRASRHTCKCGISFKRKYRLTAHMEICNAAQELGTDPNVKT